MKSILTHRMQAEFQSVHTLLEGVFLWLKFFHFIQVIILSQFLEIQNVLSHFLNLIEIKVKFLYLDIKIFLKINIP